jgi:hypothetical protein
MNKLELDPSLIPEFIKSLYGEIDLKALEAMLNSMSQDELKQMFASAIDMVKHQISAEEYKALWDLFNTVINQKGRLG